MEELTAKIDRYLSDDMSFEERQAFELEMEKDTELRKEVDLQRKTFALLEAAAFAETHQRVSELNNPHKKANLLRPLLRVAAILLVIILPTYFFISSKYTDTALYQAYASPYPDRITTMGETENSSIANAMELYNAEAYEKAAIVFEKIRQSTASNNDFIIYEAISLTNSDQAQKAIRILETEIQGNNTYNEVLEWQLILSSLANNEGDKALKLLRIFVNKDSGYQQSKAEALLQDLESIWR